MGNKNCVCNCDGTLTIDLCLCMHVVCTMQLLMRLLFSHL